jgi:hypothetical protein
VSGLQELPKTGRSIECRQCGYVGYPLVRKLIPDFTRGFFDRTHELEQTCPHCGAEERYLVWRRGVVSEEAKKIHEAAEAAADGVQKMRSLRHALFLLFFVIVLVIAFSLASG